MDFPILIIISVVFIGSVGTLLFFAGILRRKTFEEVFAEKKALTDRIYKSTVRKTKKPQNTKKDAKREKKQRRLSKETEDTEISATEQATSGDDEQSEGLSTHVEFEPDPQILNDKNQKETVTNAANKNKNKKEKKNKTINASGILVNKNAPVAVKEELKVEQQATNHFETKHPKDSLELKKEQYATSVEKKEEKQPATKKDKNVKKEKLDKQEKSEKSAVVAESAAEAIEPIVPTPIVIKEVKSSPKNQQNNKNKQKKQQKETATTREFTNAIDKLAENGTIGVSLLMHLFSRAELNRSEIQILIDFLLNRQQDMPATHSEWSDDICQKLKRQLEEKERALIEEQEASIGIQAKLRELRTEINAERIQMNAAIKMYTEKLQSKESELAGLSQELQNINDKMILERQQFQAKLLREKQAGSQELLAQLQKMQNELAHKDKYINDMVNASRQTVDDSQQKTDIIHQQLQQIRGLEREREELEEISNKRIFEIEKLKTLETDLGETKIELRNLQNDYECMKADLSQATGDLQSTRNELQKIRTIELLDKQKEIQLLQGRNDDLLQQINGIANKTQEQTREQTNLQVMIDQLKKQLIEKEQQLIAFNGDLSQKLIAYEQQTKNQAQQQQVLEQLVVALKTEVVDKQNQMQEIEKQISNKFMQRETELLSQLSLLKEKNDQQKQQLLTASLQKPSDSKSSSSSSADETKIRELLQRLCPEAVKASASTALTVAFDQWIEQVLSTYIKQSVNKQLNTQNANNNSNNSNIHKSTQSTLNSSSSSSSGGVSDNSNNYNSTHNLNNINNNLINNESNLNNSNKIKTISSSSNMNLISGNNGHDADLNDKEAENIRLRAKNEELTKLLKKTSNTLSELEVHARETDEKWRNIVHEKDGKILSLLQLNGKEDI